MNSRLKGYHYLLTLFIVFVCSVAFAGRAWSFFSTVTKRPGFNGDLYFYYNLSRGQFEMHDAIVGLISLFLILQILSPLLKQDKAKWTKAVIRFVCIFGMIIICELYLQTRFSAKG